MKYYHIFVTGYQITDRALTLQQIRERYGRIYDLEQEGHILVPAPPPQGLLRSKDLKPK